jgi:hypothetical protein
MAANFTLTLDTQGPAGVAGSITAGTQIPTTGGSTNVSGGAVNAATTVTTNIDGADLQTAGAEGDNVVKIFVQDDAGNWSV